MKNMERHFHIKWQEFLNRVNNQLPLNIQLRDDATLMSFYPGDNIEVINAIQQLTGRKEGAFMYLWGQEGVGRSHLLQAACHAASEVGINAVYVPLLEQKYFSPAILQGIEEISLICIDDIQVIMAQPAWEEALFHLFNRIQLQGNCLLVAADVSPKNLSSTLPDLKSRLASGITYQIHRLSDEQKIQALQLRAQQRGLQLAKTVGQFLLSRCSRDMVELFSILEKLDQASLAEQRRLTIPFVKQVLAL